MASSASFAGLVEMLRGGALKWILIGTASALILGFLEMLVGLGLQVMLSIMGFDVGQVSLPSPLPSVDIETLDHTTVVIFLLVIITLRGIAALGSQAAGKFAYILIYTRFRLNLFYELLKRDNPVFLSAAEINFRNSEVARKAATWVSSVTLFINSALQAFALLAVLIWVSWSLTLVGIALFGLVAFIIRMIHRRVEPVAQAIPKENRRMNAGIERIARNWMLVRVLRTNDYEYDQQVRTLTNYANLDLRVIFYSALNTIIPTQFGGYLLLFLVVIYASGASISQSMFVTFLYLFLRFQQAVAAASGTMTSLVADKPFFDLARSFQSELTVSEREAAMKPLPNVSLFKENLAHGKLRPPMGAVTDMANGEPPAIEIRNLEFSYKGDENIILNDINVSIPAGQQFGVIGPSGSGKSTLLGILLGLLEPDRGEVSLSGVSPRAYFANEGIRLGYVGAEPLLIDGTVAENLMYGWPYDHEPSREELLSAIKQAQLDQVASDRTDFLEFRLNEIGEGLSAGQKQRLSLARALLVRPHILILDEASANLDVDTEREIAKTISELKGDCTIIIVSHRPGMLEYTDSVLRLPN